MKVGFYVFVDQCRRRGKGRGWLVGQGSEPELTTRVGEIMKVFVLGPWPKVPRKVDVDSDRKGGMICSGKVYTSTSLFGALCLKHATNEFGCLDTSQVSRRPQEHWSNMIKEETFRHLCWAKIACLPRKVPPGRRIRLGQLERKKSNQKEWGIVMTC